MCHGSSTRSKPKPLACRIVGCGYKTDKKYSLKIHERTHEKVLALRKPYVCSYPNCEYRAGSQSTLTAHVKVKHGVGRNRNFQCPMCPSKFYSRKSLTFHIPIHTNERRFKCSTCKFATHCQAYLRRHVKNVHERQTKYSCSHPGCSFTTARTDSLKRHVQTHNPDPKARRPILCHFPNCSFRGRAADSMRKHASVHHNNRRSREFKRLLCPQKFYDRDSMRSHISNIHTKEKNKRCSKCSFLTRHSAMLERHFKRKHNDKPCGPRRKTKSNMTLLGVSKWRWNNKRSYKSSMHGTPEAISSGQASSLINSVSQTVPVVLLERIVVQLV